MDQLKAINPVFRKAALAFVNELDGLIVKLDGRHVVWAEVASFAHQVRGTAEFFGALGTGDAARLLELAVRSGMDAAGLEDLMAALVAEMQVDVLQLRERLHEEAQAKPAPHPPPGAGSQSPSPPTN